ncbi:MAG: hypothetical protein HY741_19005 [Chloroflexi bacterium]|nr:hypothetical protein [Chloroflexota bacterium]
MYTLEIRIENIATLEQANTLQEIIVGLAELVGGMASGGVGEAVPWNVERAAILEAVDIVDEQEAIHEQAA